MLDHGRTVAHGTPDELKARIGNDRIDVTRRPTPTSSPPPPRALAALRRQRARRSTTSARRHRPDHARASALIDVVRALDDAGIDAVDLNRRQATLDDVFLTLTAASPTGRRDRSAEEVPA